MKGRSNASVALRVFSCPTTQLPNHPSRPSNHPITQLPNHPIHRSSGFTIIELLVVLALISILASMGMAQYRQGIVHAREAVLKTDLFDLRDAIDQYYADKGQYPGSLASLVSDGYLRAVPVDPITKSVDTWQTVPSEPDPNNPTAASGIYDVKSGSDQTAIDGTKYADW
jgi:general secretion pathway protein G